MHNQLRTERSNLENDYDDKKRTTQRLIDENNQALDIYRARGQEAFDATVDFISNRKSDSGLNRQDSLSKINPIREQFDQKLDDFKNIKERLEQEQTDLSHQFNSQDQQLQTDIFNQIHQRQAKIDDLELNDDDSFY